MVKKIERSKNVELLFDAEDSDNVGPGAKASPEFVFMVNENVECNACLELSQISAAKAPLQGSSCPQ
jgi:hypothetical protein